MSEINNRALAIIPRTIEEVTDLAQRLAESNLIPATMRKKMPDVLVTILAGQELGMTPMASLRSFHVVEGKPILSADGTVALVLGSGKADYFDRVEESDTSVTYETRRRGSQVPRRCTWTIDMAKAAGLYPAKDNWRLYKRQMLAARCKVELGRDVYPDVLAGCYLDDELTPTGRVAYESTGEDVQDAEVVQRPPLLERIDAAVCQSDLDDMVPELSALTGKALAEARARFKARVVKLREEAAAVEVRDAKEWEESKQPEQRVARPDPETAPEAVS